MAAENALASSVKGKGELAVSEYGYISPAGKTLEGVGVIPDKIVELKISDLQKHRDAALEEAQQVLNKSDRLGAQPSVPPILASQKARRYPRIPLSKARNKD